MSDTIDVTDDQIRALLTETLASADPHVKLHGRTIVGQCREALGEVHLHGSTVEGSRRRIAEYLRTRAAT